MTFALISLVAAILPIHLSRRSTTGLARPALLTTLFLVAWFLLAFYFFANRLSGSGVDESVLYHLLTDMGGADYSAFRLELAGIAAALIGMLIAAGILYRQSMATGEARPRSLRYLAAVTLLALSVSTSPAVHDIHGIYRASQPWSVDDALPPGFAQPKRVSASNRKNFVYIYLESFERTYLNQEVFPGLAPNLTRLEQEALRFTEIKQARGTNWTIGGMVASQCGLPLLPRTGFTNSMGGISRFLPGATCVGDILNEQGYALHYYGGADLKFAGKGNFYATHGFKKVAGLEELKPLLKDPSYLNGWGLYDDSLFEIARHEFDVLATSTEPFGMFLLTVDTHHPEGHIPRACSGIKYGDGKNPILNAIHCSDRLVGEFVQHLRNHQAADSTTIVLASDHLAMPNTASHLLRGQNRRNLLLVLDRDIPAGEIKHPGTTFDVAPTLLSILGANIEKFAYGRNLLSSTVTSTKEETGLTVNSLIGMGRGYLEALWSYPDFRQGFYIDIQNRSARVGNQILDVPALITFNQDGKTENIFFEANAPIRLSEELQRMDPHQSFAWIDQCVRGTALVNLTDFKEDDLCMIAGRLADQRMDAQVLQNSGPTALSFALKRTADRLPEHDEADRITQRVNTLRRFNTYGSLVSETDVAEYFLQSGWRKDLDTAYKMIAKWVSPPQLAKALGLSTGGLFTGLEGNTGLRVRSSGGPTEPSFAEVTHITRSKSRVDLIRGITLLGVNGDAPPIKLKHIDTCGFGGQVHDKESFEGSIEALISSTQDLFQAHLLVVHDSGTCGGTQLEEAFRGVDLKKSHLVQTRTPYVALLSNGKAISEETGAPGSALDIAFTGIPGLERKQAARPNPVPRVAHAGGGHQGKIYTNSIDALEANKGKYKLFEIDFSWTTDGELVCLHDWDSSAVSWLQLPEKGAIRHQDYLNIVNTKGQFKHCDLESLTRWMRENPHARIVTDIKERNIDALRLIASRHPDLQQRFIPQIYQPSEYFKAKLLQYQDVIWTLYEFHGSNTDVLNHVKQMNLMGLTMPMLRAQSGLAKQVKEITGFPIWAHTINEESIAAELKLLGVDSVYTDWLPD